MQDSFFILSVEYVNLRYYMGRKPVVVIADPDMLRQVMVKDFSSFPNRLVRVTLAGTRSSNVPLSPS